MNLEQTLKTTRRRSFYMICSSAVLLFSSLGFILLLYLAHVTDLEIKSHFQTNQTDPSQNNNNNNNNNTNLSSPIVILISVDGFRADFWDQSAFRTAPSSFLNLEKFAKTGVRARRMQPVFPSKTFPNHWSIVTGLYPFQHGIVGNTFWDPVFKETFTIRTKSADSKFWQGDPIWNVCERQGIRTGTVFWPGSETVQPENQKPSDVLKPFSNSVDYNQRIEKLFEFIDNGDEFLSIYFEGVDHAGHSFGVSSNEAISNLKEQLKMIDSSLKSIVEGLEKRNKNFNIILVADHGMTDISSDTQFIDLDKLFESIDSSRYKLVDPAPSDFTPIVSLWTNKTNWQGTDLELATQLLNDIPSHDHIQFYTKQTLPKRFHYVANRRIADIIGVCDEHWVAKKQGDRPAWTGRGMHGYDNELSSMGATFIAFGSSFKSLPLVPDFKNLDVHNLIARILNIHPADTAGSALTPELLLKSNLTFEFKESSSNSGSSTGQWCSNRSTTPELKFDLSNLKMKKQMTIHVFATSYSKHSDDSIPQRIWWLQRELNNSTESLKGSVTLDTIRIADEDQNTNTTVELPLCWGYNSTSIDHNKSGWIQFVIAVVVHSDDMNDQDLLPGHVTDVYNGLEVPFRLLGAASFEIEN